MESHFAEEAIEGVGGRTWWIWFDFWRWFPGNIVFMSDQNFFGLLAFSFKIFLWWVDFAFLMWLIHWFLRSLYLWRSFVIFWSPWFSKGLVPHVHQFFSSFIQPGAWPSLYTLFDLWCVLVEDGVESWCEKVYGWLNVSWIVYRIPVDFWYIFS